MRTSTETAKLFAALAKAQGAIAEPPMTGRGQAGRQTTKYAMLKDIVPVIRKAFAPNGLAFIQSIEVIEGDRGMLATLITHTSGEWMETLYPIALSADPQRMGGAATYAKRYSLLMAAGIAGDPDDDGQGEAKAQEAERKAAEVMARKAEREAKKVAKEDADRARKGLHHRSWDSERIGFIMALKERGWAYDEAKAVLLEEGKTAPSNWTQANRQRFIVALTDGDWPKK